MAARLHPSGRPYSVVIYSGGAIEIHSAVYGRCDLSVALTPVSAIQAATYLNGGVEPCVYTYPFAAPDVT